MSINYPVYQLLPVINVFLGCICKCAAHKIYGSPPLCTHFFFQAKFHVFKIFCQSLRADNWTSLISLTHNQLDTTSQSQIWLEQIGWWFFLACTIKQVKLSTALPPVCLPKPTRSWSAGLCHRITARPANLRNNNLLEQIFYPLCVTSAPLSTLLTIRRL